MAGPRDFNVLQSGCSGVGGEPTGISEVNRGISHCGRSESEGGGVGWWVVPNIAEGTAIGSHGRLTDKSTVMFPGLRPAPTPWATRIVPFVDQQAEIGIRFIGGIQRDKMGIPATRREDVGERLRLRPRIEIGNVDSKQVGSYCYTTPDRIIPRMTTKTYQGK
ncbi:MAG: hypothetical protein OEX19_08335 [Gammaproteobacteria bacterium]|nr:hypothetical protein [Gammaproteobacteria bacterium]